MASNYPSSLPPSTRTVGTNLGTYPHSDLHDEGVEDVYAIASELGTVPSGAYATVKARLEALEATGGTWTEFTPTWTGLTLGTGVVDARYRYLAGDLYAVVFWQVGTSDSITAGTSPLTWSLPDSATAYTNVGLDPDFRWYGQFRWHDVSGLEQGDDAGGGQCWVENNATEVVAWGTNSYDPANNTIIDATRPSGGAWVIGDHLWWSIGPVEVS